MIYSSIAHLKDLLNRCGVCCRLLQPQSSTSLSIVVTCTLSETVANLCNSSSLSLHCVVTQLRICTLLSMVHSYLSSSVDKILLLNRSSFNRRDGWMEDLFYLYRSFRQTQCNTLWLYQSTTTLKLVLYLTTT